MKSNVSTADKIIRLLIGITVAVLYFTKVISGTSGIILLIIGAVLFLTALINFCPLYWILGISSKKKQNPS
jgi:hypothetical protein